MQHRLLCFLACILVVLMSMTWAQFTPEELAKRPECEQILRDAEIIRVKEIGEGVTKPLRLYLKCEGQEVSGCWKNPQGMAKGYLEGWQYEIAAYEMDKLLGVNMIPPTVEREYDGKKGSFQYWISGGMSDLERMDQGLEIPEAAVVTWAKSKYLQRAFDSLIGNEDRTQQNIRYSDDWRMILIDHSRSFRTSKKYTDNLIYGKNGAKEQKLFRVLPRAFVEKVKALTFDSIKQVVGGYLTDKEIQAVLKRKLLLLDEIAEMIKEKGESRVLY